MDRTFRKLLLLATLLLIPAVLSAIECRLMKHSIDPAALEKEVDAMWKSGFSPVGIEVIAAGADAGTWVLYTDARNTEYRGWTIVEYSSYAEMERDLNRSFRENWLPFDLAFDSGKAWVLYIRMDNDAEGWDMGRAVDGTALDKLVGAFSEKDCIPVGVTTDESEAIRMLFLKIPGHSIMDWQLKPYANRDTLEKDLDLLTDSGWEPYGFMLRDRRIHVLLLK